MDRGSLSGSLIHYSRDKQPESLGSKAEESTMMEVEIVSRENIKPTSPTPHHLRTYKISCLDQILRPTPITLVFFYPNTKKTNLSMVISDKIERLKQSLSETLTRFYPFAGKIKDNVSIDCNDEGVYYVEARVNYCLSDFLSQVDFSLISKLVPDEPKSIDLLSEIYVMRVQVSIFTCDGIAICMSISHKLADGQTWATFFKAWAATARGCSEAIYPCFIAPSLFPQQPFMSSLSPPTLVTHKLLTRRFVFDALALATLKTKLVSSSFSRDPTRVEAVSTLIWKCATVASRATHGTKNKSSFFAIPMNLRRKISPPLSDESIGNIIWTAIAQSLPNTELELCYMVGHIRNAIQEINSDFVEEMKGDRGYLKIIDRLTRLGELFSDNNEFDVFSLTCTCNTGLYDADFGWGKPIWFNLYNQGLTNIIILADTRSGGGIEACVTLNEQDMIIFERDPELLAFTSLDHNPLKLDNLGSATSV